VCLSCCRVVRQPETNHQRERERKDEAPLFLHRHTSLTPSSPHTSPPKPTHPPLPPHNTTRQHKHRLLPTRPVPANGSGEQGHHPTTPTLLSPSRHSSTCDPPIRAPTDAGPGHATRKERHVARLFTSALESRASFAAAGGDESWGWTPVTLAPAQVLEAAGAVSAGGVGGWEGEGEGEGEMDHDRYGYYDEEECCYHEQR
jgi:hypothetical protein